MILAFAYEDAAGYKDRSANASLSPTRLVKTSRFRLTQVSTDEVEEKNGTAAKGEYASRRMMQDCLQSYI